MPYPYERATLQPLHALLNTPHIHSTLHSFHSCLPDILIPANRVHRSDFAAPRWQPDTMLAFDGSLVEAPLSSANPLSRVVYLSVGATCHDSAALRHLDQHRPIDPVAYRAAIQTHRLQAVLPFTHVVTAQAATTVDAFRQSVYDLCATNRVAADAESLLETFAVLLAHRQQPRSTALRYLTDTLGIHGRMAPWGGQWRIMTETLRAIEFLWLVHYLRWWAAKNHGLPATLAIIVDGPLAVFGNASWLSRAVRHELARVFQVSATTATVPMLIGIEKTGGLVDYAAMLDMCGALEPQTAFLLTHTDIRRAMQGDAENTAAYGMQHYIGRKLIYKTINEQVVVVNVPSLTAEQHAASTAYPSQFPRLPAIMDYLDSATQTPYQNGVSGIIAAHTASALSASVLQCVAPHLA